MISARVCVYFWVCLCVHNVFKKIMSYLSDDYVCDQQRNLNKKKKNLFILLDY